MNEAIRKLKKVPFDLDKILEELQSNSGSGSSSAEIKMFKKSIEASQLTNNDNGLYEATINHTLASEITSVLVKSTDTKETVDFSCIELNDNSVKIIIAESISIDVILLGKNSVVEDVNITSENIEFNADEFTANNVKAAIIENRTEIKNLKQFANSGKSRIASAIGTPLTESDTFETMEEKINTLTSEFKSKLTEKGVEIVEDDKISSMINKIDEVKTGVEVEGIENLPAWATLKVENMYFNAASMSILRSGLQCSSINDKIYSLGGKTILNNTPTNVNECYDTISNTWTTKENMITERYSLTSSTVDNKIYCIAGVGRGDDVFANECYDNNNNTWTSKQSLNIIRFDCGSSTFDNKIYCIGGRNFDEDLNNNNDCYDTNTDIWTSKANMLLAKHLMGISTVNEKIYSIAGFTYKKDKAVITTNSTNQSYDPIKNEWNYNKSMENNIGASCSSVVNNNIYIMGAIVERDTSNICYIP